MYVKSDIEEKLELLPDLVADALERWRICTLAREQFDALLAARLRGENPEANSSIIKELVAANEGHYQAKLDEIKAEAEHCRLYEKLMCAKKEASQRTAF